MTFRRGILLFIGSCAVSSAADRFIAPAGSDANSGSLEQPWQTFAHAADQLAAGDTLFLRGGTYAERLILTGTSGTAEAPIVIRNYESESPVIDGETVTVPAGGRVGLVVLDNCSRVHLSGIEVKNFVTTVATRTPAGIQIEGSGSGLQVTACKVHHIWQSSTSASANGFGIAVYGTSATPIDGLVLDGNEVFDLRTGQSESVVLNGNVINFIVSRNHVYDCNNIGIDFIGYEGSAPAAVDRARDGICRENHVHDIDTSHNPGYGGNFTNGGGERSAAGIYIDGGINITVERNHVHDCDFGIELASEHASGFTEQIRLLDNLLHHNLGAGLIMGGYDSNRGKTRLCQIRNNTFFRNDTLQAGGGQIALQFYLENNVFKSNIIWADATTKQMVVHYVEGGTAAQRAFGPGNVFDYNLYFCEGAEGEIEFGLNSTGSGGSSGNKSYYGLAAWRAAVGSDAKSDFHDPGFAVPVPGAAAAPPDFKLTSASFSRDRGEPSPPYTPVAGEKDFAGASRIANNRVDVGCHEFMTGLQAWRDAHFSLPDGGAGAGNEDDPDGDGVRNLVEYSQGMDPNVPDVSFAPGGLLTSGFFRFRYRKNAPQLDYAVQISSTLDDWIATDLPEQSDGSGSFWRDFPLGPGSRFVRLAVSP